MPSYTRINFVQNSSPPINATNLNKMDAQCGAVQYGFNVIGGPGTPNGYQLLSNASISANATSTITCTGVGTVPAGAIAVVLFGYFGASAIGLQLYFFPHGSTTGPQRIATATTIATDFHTVIAYLDSTGKLDLVAGSGGNITGLYMWMGAYFY